MTSFALQMTASWFRWVFGLALGHVGWGGIVAGIAGVVLLLAASPKVMKLLFSPRGIVVTATVMFAALTTLWWGWGGPPPSSDRAVALSAPVEPSKAVEKAPPKPKAAKVELAAVLPKTPAKPAKIKQPMPMLPMADFSWNSITPFWMPPPSIVRFPSLVATNLKHLIVHPHAGNPHHAAAKPAGTKANPSNISARRADKATSPTGSPTKPIHAAAKHRPSHTAAKAVAVHAGHVGHQGIDAGHVAQHNATPAANGVAVHRPLTAAEIHHLRNQQAAYMMQLEMDNMFSGQMGGMHPMNNHPMNGMHPTEGTHHTGAMHPMGGAGMGHTGGTQHGAAHHR